MAVKNTINTWVVTLFYNKIDNLAAHGQNCKVYKNKW